MHKDIAFHILEARGACISFVTNECSAPTNQQRGADGILHCYSIGEPLAVFDDKTQVNDRDKGTAQLKVIGELAVVNLV